jgi:hypothetical protein
VKIVPVGDPPLSSSAHPLVNVTSGWDRIVQGPVWCSGPESGNYIGLTSGPIPFDSDVDVAQMVTVGLHDGVDHRYEVGELLPDTYEHRSIVQTSTVMENGTNQLAVNPINPPGIVEEALGDGLLVQELL